MQRATQAASAARVPAYVLEWQWSRVEVLTTHGREQGTVSEVRRFRSVDKMVTRMNVLLDSGGMKYALDSEVTKIAPPSIRNMEIAAYGQPPTEATSEGSGTDENRARDRDADSARHCA